MGCDRHGKVWRASMVLSVVGVAVVLMSCVAAPADEMATVEVVLKGGRGVDAVQCADQDTGGLVAPLRAAAAEKAGKESYDIELFPGALLHVGLRSKGEDRKQETAFPLVYDGRQKKLLFSREGFTASLNGKVVYVDLADPKAADWVRQQPAAKLKSIRTIRLSGKPDTDRLAMGRLAGSGVLIVPPAGFFENINPGVLKPLVAAKPIGVIPDREVDLGAIPPELSGVRYLALTGANLPDLKPFGKLEYFMFQFKQPEKPDLAQLAQLTQLRCLVLAKCKGVMDYKCIAKLKDLRSLVLTKCDQMKDVSAIQDCRGLQSLALFECEKLQDLAPLAKLQKLRYLSIMPVNPSADLKPLKKLKKLKVLIVDNDGMKKRPADYDDLRKARPDIEIVGFCMGSAWILAVVPVAIAGGMLWRRRRPLRKVPQ